MLAPVFILIGVTIVLAVGIFNENAASTNLDQVKEFLMELGTWTQKYYPTPIWLEDSVNCTVTCRVFPYSIQVTILNQ